MVGEAHSSEDCRKEREEENSLGGGEAYRAPWYCTPRAVDLGMRVYIYEPIR